jgi:bifunctional DNase/RNase
MDADRGREIEMIVESVRVHMPTGRHVLVLREVDASRLLMVWVGPWEASAIAMKLQGLTPERPLTHDLFATVLTTLGVSVERIVITDLADETYHARLELNRSGERYAIDARPSDAIALAVRLGVSVYASSDVLDRAGTVPDEDDEDEDEEVGEEAGATAGRRRRPAVPESTGEVLDQTRLAIFRDFVNSLDPDSEQRGGTSSS